MIYLIKRGFYLIKSSISRNSPTSSVKRFFAEIYYSSIWEYLKPTVSPQHKSPKGFLFKVSLALVSLYSLHKALSKTLAMAKTRNTATPASSSRKRPRDTKPNRVIIDTTVEEIESSNHSAEDILSSDDDSAAVPILKKSRYAIKFINSELETRYRDFNFVGRKVMYGKSVVGSEFADCG